MFINTLHIMLLNNIPSESDKTLCINIDKPLIVYMICKLLVVYLC